MRKNQWLTLGAADFFKQEILNTRVTIDNVRRDAWNKSGAMFYIHEQKKFQTKKTKRSAASAFEI